MRTVQVGDATVDKVVDQAVGALPYRDLFPHSDWSLFERHGDWLDPASVDAEAQLIYLSFHSFVVRLAGKTVLIDTCIGNDKSRGGDPLYHKRNGSYLERLRDIGIDRSQVDYVMCTHLHADHVGWNTFLDDGVWRPTFPNANYVFARSEFTYWKDRIKRQPKGDWQEPSYFDSILPVVENGRYELVEDAHQVLPGLVVHSAPGHSPGHAVIWLERLRESCVFSGDVIHHAIQLAAPDLVPVYDMDPIEAAGTRHRLLNRIADTETVLLTAHFPGVTAGRVRRGRYAFRFEYFDT